MAHVGWISQCADFLYYVIVHMLDVSVGDSLFMRECEIRYWDFIGNKLRQTVSRFDFVGKIIGRKDPS